MAERGTVPKVELFDGAYYAGRSRNLTVARWDATTSRFYGWRAKFGQTFLVRIPHLEDQPTRFDCFLPMLRVYDHQVREVPLPPHEFPVGDEG